MRFSSIREGFSNIALSSATPEIFIGDTFDFLLRRRLEMREYQPLQPSSLEWKELTEPTILSKELPSLNSRIFSLDFYKVLEDGDGWSIANNSISQNINLEKVGMTH